MKEYILQVRRTVGNSALWWAKNIRGFTTDPYEAQTYDEDTAKKYEISCEVKAWEKSQVLHLAEHHVDVGKLVEEMYKAQNHVL